MHEIAGNSVEGEIEKYSLYSPRTCVSIVRYVKASAYVFHRQIVESSFIH